MSPRKLQRLILAGFFAMWLLAVGQQPGVVSAFAGELQAVEQRLSAAPAELEALLPTEHNSKVIEYWGGIVCAAGAQPGTHAATSDQQCTETGIEPGMVEE